MRCSSNRFDVNFLKGVGVNVAAPENLRREFPIPYPIG